MLTEIIFEVRLFFDIKAMVASEIEIVLNQTMMMENLRTLEKVNI
jgi:hypothetical protein